MCGVISTSHVRRVSTGSCGIQLKHNRLSDTCPRGTIIISYSIISLLYAIVNVLCMCALVLLASWPQFGLVPCVQWCLQFAHMIATYFISGVRHAFYIIRTYA